MHISRIAIENFRNFRSVDFQTGTHLVVLGENQSGKTNLVHALRLILDNSLPDSARQLTADDFHDSHQEPFANGIPISVSIEVSEFDSDTDVAAVLGLRSTANPSDKSR